MLVAARPHIQAALTPILPRQAFQSSWQTTSVNSSKRNDAHKHKTSSSPNRCNNSKTTVVKQVIIKQRIKVRLPVRDMGQATNFYRCLFYFTF